MSAAVFSRIYRQNAWHGVESLSGPGSGMAPTRRISEALRELVERHRIRAVLNVGCGDDLWTPDLPGYLGIDVAPEAVERARRFHPFRSYEVSTEIPEGYDLVIVRDVLQHLSFRDGTALLGRILESAPGYLLASTYTAASERHGDPLNEDIQTGQCYSPDLTAPPFSMRKPDRLIPDGYDYRDPMVIRDGAKYLGLWKL